MLNLECFDPGLLIFFKGFPTTHWQKSSSLKRLKSFEILLALLGPNHQGTVVQGSPGISFSFVFFLKTTTKLRTLILASTMHLQTDLHILSLVPLGL